MKEGRKEGKKEGKKEGRKEWQLLCPLLIPKKALIDVAFPPLPPLLFDLSDRDQSQKFLSSARESASSEFGISQGPKSF